MLKRIQHPTFCVSGARKQKKYLNVVVTGGTRGLGKAMVKEFVARGDKVFILSRTTTAIDQVCIEIPGVYGQAVDVSNHHAVNRVIDSHFMGHSIEEGRSIDIWINNAAMSGGYKAIGDGEGELWDTVVRTNLLGCVHGCNTAHRVMKGQTTGGVVYNVTGAGSDGRATEMYGVYGATKAGVAQLTRSLQKEWSGSGVDCGILSPGMMLTPLLLDGIDNQLLGKIAWLCYNVDEVAPVVVDEMRRGYFDSHGNGKGPYIRFLTPSRIIQRVIEQCQGKIN